MGNCQTVDAAALVIQHPNGRLERMFWPVTASEVMKTNPGHYVSLIIPLPADNSSSGNNNDNELEENSDNNNNNNKSKTVRFTRVKLLRPSDTLVLGRAYRLVTTQEVMKVLRAKKHAKIRREKSESSSTVVDVQLTNNQEIQNLMSNSQSETGRSVQDNQVKRPADRHRQRRLTKPWNPSLQSISESGS